MFNIGGGELLVIALIALIVLGPQRLPDAARQVGKAMGELRRMSSGFQQELRSALDESESPSGPRRDVLGVTKPAEKPTNGTTRDVASARKLPAGAPGDGGDDPARAAVRSVSGQTTANGKSARPRRTPLRAAPAADEDAPSAGRRRSAP